MNVPAPESLTINLGEQDWPAKFAAALNARNDWVAAKLAEHDRILVVLGMALASAQPDVAKGIASALEEGTASDAPRTTFTEFWIGVLRGSPSPADVPPTLRLVVDNTSTNG